MEAVAMIVIAFALFALLVLGWLAAPNSTAVAAKPAAAPAPKLHLGESHA
jgi:hypothetical protein